MGKAVVMGLLERHGVARTMVVPTRKKCDLQEQVRQNVEPGSELFTDALMSYDGLNSECAHQVIGRAEKYVDGQVHTNGMENFWSLLMRSINGTYVSVEPFHLFQYLDEQTFRYNARNCNDAERFQQVRRGDRRKAVDLQGPDRRWALMSKKSNPKGKKEENPEEPEEWKKFKELARKVMSAPPMPRELRKVRPVLESQSEPGGRYNGDVKTPKPAL